MESNWEIAEKKRGASSYKEIVRFLREVRKGTENVIEETE